MKQLIHFHVSTTSDLLCQIHNLHQLYVARSQNLFNNMDSVLSKCIEYFEQAQQAEKSSRARSLLSDLNTCIRGYHPYQFEKINQHKRDMQFIIGLQIIKEAERMLQNEYNIQKAKLDEAIPHIQNLVLAGFQMAILQNKHLVKNRQQAILEALWNELAMDTNLALLQKKIMLIASFHDAIILFDKVLDALEI